MIILHLADLHLHPRWFEWLATSAPAHDILCLSGDLLAADDPAPHARQVERALGWLRRIESPMVISGGDHDVERDHRRRPLPARWLQDLAGPRVAVDGGTLVCGGVRFHAVGCATYPKGAAADVWVAHAPPTGLAVGRQAYGFDDGDPDLDEALVRQRPAMVLAGRIHEPATWFERRDGIVYINPGSVAHGRFPNHALVDWGNRTAHRLQDGFAGAVCEVATWSAADEAAAIPSLAS